MGYLATLRSEFGEQIKPPFMSISISDLKTIDLLFWLNVHGRCVLSVSCALASHCTRNRASLNVGAGCKYKLKEGGGLLNICVFHFLTRPYTRYYMASELDPSFQLCAHRNAYTDPCVLNECYSN